MSSMRKLPVAVAIAILCASLAACSESDADDVMDRLHDLLYALEQQGQDEYDFDPFNNEYDWTEKFFDTWPDGLPLPGGQAADEIGGTWGGWSGQDLGAAEEYGERLEDAGWDLGSQTTETDEATGWETTTSTYQNESGEQITVTSVDTGGTERVKVDF